MSASTEHSKQSSSRDRRKSDDHSEVSDSENRLESRAQVLQQMQQHAVERINSYPAITHAAVVSLFLVPIAALPYLASRRRFYALKRQIRSLESNTKILKADFDSALQGQRLMYESKIQELEFNNMRTSETLHALRIAIDQHNSDREKHLGEIETDVQRALKETHHSRDKQAQLLYGLGMALADIATFMQEVEMKFGMNQDTPDKLRSAAVEIQSISKQMRADVRWEAEH